MNKGFGLAPVKTEGHYYLDESFDPALNEPNRIFNEIVLLMDRLNKELISVPYGGKVYRKKVYKSLKHRILCFKGKGV